MEPETVFQQFPLRFDAAQLAREVSQFSEAEWISLSGEPTGNSVVILVSVGGTLNADFAISGAMRPTRFLERCPYLQQVIAALERSVSRCRLIRLPAETELSAGMLWNYHWFRRVPVYIPIVTDPAVTLFCHDQEIQLAPGEVWTFDHRYPNWMANASPQDCIHLVIELRASSPFLTPDLTGFKNLSGLIREIPYIPDQKSEIPLEPYRFEVLTPEEIRSLTTDIVSAVEHTQIPPEQFLTCMQQIEIFQQRWQTTFDRSGHHPAAELAYQDLIIDFTEQIVPRVQKWLTGSDRLGQNAIEVLRTMLLTTPPAPKRINRHIMIKKKRELDGVCPENMLWPEFKKPLFIVSAPRAGSTLLFETLCRFPEVWTIAEESHETIESIPELHPAAKNYRSNRLTETDAQPHIVSTLRGNFSRELQNRAGQAYFNLPERQRPTQVRFVEKTPKNALRIPFLKAAFPDARFIYLYRDPKENISSLMEGWRSRRFIGYRGLPGWPFKEWSFLLIPGWSSLQDCSVAEIAATQWKISNEYILEDLRKLPSSAWHVVRYHDLIQHPGATLKELSGFAEFHWDAAVEQAISRHLPLSRFTLSAPSRDKWRKHEQEILAILPSLEPVIRQMEKDLEPK